MIRSRERQAGKTATVHIPTLQRPVYGLLLALTLWVITVLFINIQQFLGGPVAHRAILDIAGDAVFLLAGLFAAALALQIVVPRKMRNNARVLLLVLISLVATAAAQVALYGAQTAFVIQPEVIAFLLPFALAPLMATMLVGAPAGVLLGFWTSLVMAIMLDRSFSVLLTGIVASVVAAQIADRVRTRAKVIRAGVVVGLAQVTLVLAMTALDGRTTDVMRVFDQAGACLLSGFLSALLVLLILPAFESAFKITTNLTLLELTDLGHPLLQRLAMEAPGTYHHSLIVASLAQVAADDIGANSLLTRVCAYFHDIGKMTKPDFFAENINQRGNPHDDLPPSMSTLVITSHVKEGLTLAMMHKLPTPVRAVIQEHHGTSIVTCFHHKAKSQQDKEVAGGNGRIDEGAFRYPGPRPSFKESAIICLADSIEAASRSIEKTSPSHIEQLVNTIVNKRLTDGQLDECELTLQELSRVKRSFVFTLTNMLHGRVPYPKDEDNQQPRPSATGRAEDRGVGRVSPGTSRGTGPETAHA
ncbi:MAG: HDIG domain-containing protein [Lentisphaerae bacterium]|nr:HDIG domain-containing protein [Lentisphaerota bacterium]